MRQMMSISKHHGVRLAYQAGCRCLPCCAANSTYRPTPLVDAGPARAHLKALAAGAVGHARAAQLSGVAVSQLRQIRVGTTTRVRVTTAARILAIPVRPALGVRISAVEARRKVRQLQRERLTKTQIAHALGYQSPRVQLGRTAVTLRTALKVKQLHRRMMTVPGDGEDARLDRCVGCADDLAVD
jgi:hypothetical protein